MRDSSQCYPKILWNKTKSDVALLMTQIGYFSLEWPNNPSMTIKAQKAKNMENHNNVEDIKNSNPESEVHKYKYNQIYND